MKDYSVHQLAGKVCPRSVRAWLPRLRHSALLIVLVIGSLTGTVFAASELPFTEAFDDDNGTSLHNLRGWEVDGESATVEEGRANIQWATLSQQFVPEASAVRITFDLAPVFAKEPPLFPLGARFGFYVSTNGIVVPRSGGEFIDVAHTPLVSGAEVAFVLNIDYPAGTWDLAADGILIATNLALSSSAPGDRFRKLGFVDTGMNTPTRLNDVEIALSRSTDSRVLPFIETFDTLALGDLNAQRQWEAADVIVQTAIVREGPRAAALTSRDSRMRHAFLEGESNAWVQVYMRPLHGSVPLPPPNSTFAFYVNEEGLIMAYNGTTKTQLVHRVLATNRWSQFVVYADYGTHRWDLFLNGKQVAESLDFYNTNAVTFGAIGLRGGGDGTSTYVDDISISRRSPLVLGAVFIVR